MKVCWSLPVIYFCWLAFPLDLYVYGDEMGKLLPVSLRYIFPSYGLYSSLSLK